VAYRSSDAVGWLIPAASDKGETAKTLVATSLTLPPQDREQMQLVHGDVEEPNEGRECCETLPCSTDDDCRRK
jgi:hypothetical protein